MDNLPSLLEVIATELPSCQDAHRIYDLNVQLAHLGASLSSNDSDALYGSSSTRAASPLTSSLDPSAGRPSPFKQHRHPYSTPGAHYQPVS